VLQHLGIERHLQLEATTGWRATSTHLSPQSLRKIASVLNRAALHEISAAGPPRTVLPMASSTSENKDNSSRNGILATLQTGTNLLEHKCCWWDVVDRSTEPKRKLNPEGTRLDVLKEKQPLINAIICRARAKQFMPASTGLHLAISID